MNNKLKEWAADALFTILVFISAMAFVMTPALIAQQVVRAKTFSTKRVEVYYSKDSQRCFAYGVSGEKVQFRSRLEAKNYATKKGGAVKWVYMSPSVKADIRYRDEIRKQPRVEVEDGKDP